MGLDTLLILSQFKYEPNRIETDIDSFKSIDAAPDTPLGEEAPGEDTEEVQIDCENQFSWGMK